MQVIRDIIKLSPLLFIGFLLLFNRPFVGVSILGFRIGELIIAGGLFFSFAIFLIFLLFPKYLSYFESFSSKVYFLIIVFSFIVSLYVKNTDLFNVYTYRISSYIWTTAYLFIGAFLINNQDILRKYKTILLPSFLFVPFAHYLMSTGYYPDFIIRFFNQFSDKFEFTKASDIMLSLIIANILNYKLTISKYFKLSYLFVSSALMAPLLLKMSRGSFLGLFLFFIISLFYFRKYIFENIKKTIYLLIVSSIFFLGSTYNINGVDLSFNLNFSSEVIILDGAAEETSIKENIKKIVRKDTQRNAFLSLYFEDGRLYSIDQTTNWRLDIWQDVLEDMNKKNMILSGYGYNEILPVMTDPTAPGRLGRDGLNEHVHNYFVNIFARGGILQFIVFLLFHLSIVLYWNRKYLNYTILIFILPILIAASLDMSMEGVQYPVVYYLFLGYLLSTQQKSKIINF